MYSSFSFQQPQQQMATVHCSQVSLDHKPDYSASIRANQALHRNNSKLNHCSAYYCLSFPCSSPSLPSPVSPSSSNCSPSPSPSTSTKSGKMTNKSNKAAAKSKRAEQNRAAQRAFRLRKERYVKELERKAQLLEEWKAEVEFLRQENQQLRDVVFTTTHLYI